MGYGAENPVINQDSYFLVEREDSAFRKKVLKLTAVPHVNVWACVEHVPVSWDKVDVALSHVIEDNFDLVDARIKISVAPQKKGLWLKNPTKNAEMAIWHEVADIDFNQHELLDIDKRPEELFDVLARDEVATVEIPAAIREQGPYCLKVEVCTSNPESELFSRGYQWEGIGITRHAQPEAVVNMKVQVSHYERIVSSMGMSVMQIKQQ